MSFCTAINCMDGRVQLPVINFLMRRFSVEYIDSVTEAGPVKILAEQTDRVTVDSIYRRVSISTEKHGGRAVAICAHADCAGNPTEEETQKQQLITAVEYLENQFPDIEFLKLWVDSTWAVHELP